MNAMQRSQRAFTLDQTTMIAKPKRPFFLNLFIIRLPVTGVSSILHRAAGVLLVFLLPVLLYGLDRSLRDANGFEKVVNAFQAIPGRLLLLILAVLFAQHLATGVRHLLLSIGVGLSLRAATRSAWATLVFTLAVLFMFGLSMI